MKALLTATLSAALCLAPLRAHAEPKGSEDVAEAKKAIASANAKYGAAIAQRDAATIRDLYTDDAIVLPPGLAMIHGKAGVEDLWKGSFANGVKAASFQTQDVERNGDVAVETGTFTMKIAPEGKAEQTNAGKYVVVWKRQNDGSWKLHRDIWNGTRQAKK